VTRIIAGALRGRRLAAPRGARTRPTSDKVRGAVFNLLGQFFEGGDVLDLYAGTGALGLEAVSRGCARAVLVESDRDAVAAIERNVEALGLAGRVEVRRGRVVEVLPRLPAGAFALAFVDPPYEEGPEGALALLAARMALVDRRGYGDTGISIYRRD
jgi:16S rRNA (guanine966-N2)-methyltransferase